MPKTNITYLNTGIYSVAEAARLSGVSSGRIRRWLRGYRFRSRKKRYAVPPLWSGQLEPIDQKLALGFLDLIEVRFVDAFLQAGVTWAMIHKAREKAAQQFPGESHPFCTRRFVTDGRELFVALHKETGEPSLLEIATSQQVFADIVRPFIKDLEFGEGDILERWWPMGKDRQVALDPKRNFGQPTIFTDGIPTKVLARSVKANGSIEEVARWYEITFESVKEAVEYEQLLAA